MTRLTVWLLSLRIPRWLIVAGAAYSALCIALVQFGVVEL